MMSQAPRITLDQIREFTPLERMDLGTANGISNPAKMEKVIKFLENFEMTSADKVFVLQHANDSGFSEKAFTHTVSYMNSHGGNQQVLEKTVKFVSVTGEEMTRPNTVIPMPFDVPPKRPLVQRLAVIIGTFTKVSQGKVIAYCNMKELLKAWKGTTFRPAGIPILQNCFIDIAKHDAAFQLRLQAKSAVSEDEYLVLIPQILNRCPMNDFIAINEIVVYQLFEFFSSRVAPDGVVEYKRKTVLLPAKSGEKAKRVPLIPEKNLAKLTDVFVNLTPVQASEFERIRVEIGVPTLYFIRDYIDPSHTFQDVVGTMDAVVKGFQLGNLLRGSEGIATSRLYEQLGFSGLSDDFEKRVCLTLAMTLGAHAQIRALQETPIMDVQLSSVGEAAIMHNSLSIHLPGDKMWRLILPEAGDFPKVHPGLHSRCLGRSRVEACYVRVSSLEFQTQPTMGDYRVKCNQDLPSHGPKYFVLHTPVYGPYWWQTEKSAEMEKAELSLGSSNSFIPVSPPPKPLTVYRYGSSARLKAIVTDLPALDLIGIKDRMFTTIVLQKMVNEETWYKQILTSMADKNSYFVNPYAHFNPISNLPVASKTSVIFSRVTLVANEDYLSGDVTHFQVEAEDDSDEGEWVRSPTDIKNQDQEREQAEVAAIREMVEKYEQHDRESESETDSSEEDVPDAEVRKPPRVIQPPPPRAVPVASGQAEVKKGKKKKSSRVAPPLGDWEEEAASRSKIDLSKVAFDPQY